MTQFAIGYNITGLKWWIDNPKQLYTYD